MPKIIPQTHQGGYACGCRSAYKLNPAFIPDFEALMAKASVWIIQQKIGGHPWSPWQCFAIQSAAEQHLRIAQARLYEQFMRTNIRYRVREAKYVREEES